MPAIYIENSDGSESLVPKSVDGNLVIVHAISRKFILRRGKDVLCVFNEAYDRVGINPGTNTTSPSVERVVKTGRTIGAHEDTKPAFPGNAVNRRRRLIDNSPLLSVAPSRLPSWPSLDLPCGR